MVDETDIGGSGGEWPTGIETTIARTTATRGPPTADLVFDLLSHSHRRFVCYCLRGREEAMNVSILAEHVADLLEASTSSSSTTYERVYARLNHATLPRLADAGVVVVDRDVGIVEPTDAIEAMGPLLEMAAELDFESTPPPVENATTE